MSKAKSTKKKPDKIVEHRISTPLPKVHTLGMVAFIITIVGLFATFLIPFFFQITGLILGHIALSDFNKDDQMYSGKGFIIASLVINYIVIAIAVLIVFVLGIGLTLLSGYTS